MIRTLLFYLFPPRPRAIRYESKPKPTSTDDLHARLKAENEMARLLLAGKETRV